MFTVLARMNTPDFFSYDYRDWYHPENLNPSPSDTPIYDDAELEGMKRRLAGFKTDALDEGIHAEFRIVNIPGAPAALDFGFSYQPMLSDLDDNVDLKDCPVIWTTEGETVRAIAVYSMGLYGLEILKAEGDVVIFREPEKFNYQKATVEDDSFMWGEYRVPLGECMRV